MNPKLTEKTIVIADDHISVREGLCQMVAGFEGMKVTNVVYDGNMLLQSVRIQQPDLVITDIRMPGLDGLEAAKIIKVEYPAVFLVAYINEENDYLFLQLIKNGFDGIVLKKSGKAETRQVLSMVLNGYECFCNAAQERITRLIARGYYNPRRNMVKLPLSVKEMEVLQYICDGLTSKQIAENLNLSERTIEDHRESLKIKTGCTNTAGLVNYAHREGLVVYRK